MGLFHLTLAVLAAAAPAAAFLHVPRSQCSNLLEKPMVEISEELGDKTVNTGETLDLTCKVVSTPSAAIIWLHNGKEIESHGTPEAEAMTVGQRIGVGEIEARLVRRCVTEADAGEYTCMAVTPCSEPVLSTSTVSVNKANRPGKCMPLLAAPHISLFTASRMELPVNPVQLMCRTPARGAKTVWERLDEDGRGRLVKGLNGFMQLDNGDLIVDGSAQGEEDLASMTLRCTVHSMTGLAEAVTSILFLDP